MRDKLFNVGDRVYFGRPNGEKTLGEVVKVNRKTYKVKTLEGRGRSGRGMGVIWGVPESLMSAAPGSSRPAKPATRTRRQKARTPAPLRSKAALLSLISDVDCQLSPENLSCDGEASAAHVRRTAKVLNAKLDALYRELGRKVAEGEA